MDIHEGGHHKAISRPGARAARRAGVSAWISLGSESDIVDAGVRRSQAS
jgi:hypothetical protein